MSLTPPPTDASSTRTVRGTDLASFLRRGAPLALFVALLAGGIAFIAARNAEPVYRATSTLLSAEPSGGGDIVAPPRVAPDAYRTALLEGPVIPDALEAVRGARPGEAEIEEFLRRVEVEVEDQEVSGIVRIGVRDSDPERAALLANTIAEELVAWDRGRVADAAGATTVARLSHLRVAAPPERAVGPRLVFDTFVATVIGLVAGYLLLFVRDSVDRRVRGRDELVDATGLPVLAEFPRRARSTRELAAEAAGFFHTNLLLATGATSPLVLVISSPSSPAEKEGVAVGLAESFARAGRRTLLIDGDLRRPGATEGLDVRTKGSAPFEVHLENPDRRYAPATVAIGGKGTFDFVPSFTSSRYPVELLNKGLADQMGRWREAYEVIVVDSTPVLPFADTLAIAPHCTGLVLCASAEESTRDSIAAALASLRRADVRVLGTVLTGVSASRRLQRSAAGGEAGAGDATHDPYRTLGRTSDGPRAGAAERP